MASAELGPVWRSIRRHRAFSLLVTEVALGFFIIGNLVMTCRWYAAHALPPPGHPQADVLEVVRRGPALPDDDQGARAETWRHDEARALAAIPGVRHVAAVTSTALDDRWGVPDVFWTEGGADVVRGPSACAGVARSPAGSVAGWAVGASAGIVDTLELRVIEGSAATDGAVAPDARLPGAVITRCLRDALFGGGPAVGRTLLSDHATPTPIVAVVEDVRLRGSFAYQPLVAAILPGWVEDPRVGRYVVRTEPGRAAAVQEAVAAALDRARPLAAAPARDEVVTAREFRDAHTYSVGLARGTVWILAIMGALLGGLAILGNVAVAAFLVGDRRRIIGVRRALGATRGDILRYLIIENLLPTQLGNLLGFVVVLASLPATKLRFADIRFDAVDALGTALLLSLGGILAKLVPALRATRIPPSVVTRGL